VLEVILFDREIEKEGEAVRDTDGEVVFEVEAERLIVALGLDEGVFVSVAD